MSQIQWKENKEKCNELKKEEINIVKLWKIISKLEKSKQSEKTITRYFI